MDTINEVIKKICHNFSSLFLFCILKLGFFTVHTNYMAINAIRRVQNMEIKEPNDSDSTICKIRRE